MLLNASRINSIFFQDWSLDLVATTISHDLWVYHVLIECRNDFRKMEP
jgi:hypothetical protein